MTTMQTPMREFLASDLDFLNTVFELLQVFSTFNRDTMTRLELYTLLTSESRKQLVAANLILQDMLDTIAPAPMSQCVIVEDKEPATMEIVDMDSQISSLLPFDGQEYLRLHAWSTNHITGAFQMVSARHVSPDGQDRDAYWYEFFGLSKSEQLETLTDIANMSELDEVSDRQQSVHGNLAYGGYLSFKDRWWPASRFCKCLGYSVDGYGNISCKLCSSNSELIQAIEILKCERGLCEQQFEYHNSAPHIVSAAI